MFLRCQRCNHQWDYQGNNAYVAHCPHCKTSVSIKQGEKRVRESADSGAMSSPCCGAGVEQIFGRNLYVCSKCGIYSTMVDGELTVDNSDAARKYVEKTQAEKVE